MSSDFVFLKSKDELLQTGIFKKVYSESKGNYAILILCSIRNYYCIYKYVLLLLFLCCSVVLYGNNRRHIVILQDNSGSFYSNRNQEKIDDVQSGILKLFKGELLNNDYNNLREEKNNKIPFFDSDADEVSFYWFVASQYSNLYFRDKTDGGYSCFEEYFLQHGAVLNFKESGVDIEAFIKRNFADRPLINASNNMFVKGLGTYSFTAYAYPLVLDKLISDYAEEYVFIVVSDFKAGSTFGNRMDEQIFRDAFHSKANSVVERVNWLNAQFYRIEYFDYYVNEPQGGIIGLTAFKTRPNCGLYSPENISLRINSNVIFDQETYQGDKYMMRSNQIVFEHNSKLHVDKIIIEVSGILEKPCRREVTDFVVDSISMIYHIPAKEMIFGGYNDFLINKEGIVRFVFQASYDLGNGTPIKYNFDVERSIGNDNFIFLTKLSLKQKTGMMSIVVFVIILTVLVILFRRGKPTDFELTSNEFTDSYESFDFSEKGSGRILTDYRSWTAEDENNGKFCIKVRGKLSYKSNNCFYNWKEETGFPVYITPMQLDVPDGFEAYIQCGNRSTNSSDHSVYYDSAFKNGEFQFEIIFSKVDRVMKVDEPLRFSFIIDVRGVNNGLKSFDFSKQLSYSFHVGPELGSVWVGIDPGTTGSCIATGTTNRDLAIAKTAQKKDSISPSVIMIDTSKINHQSDDEIRNATLFGAMADAFAESKNRRKFVSVKKLLGYDEQFQLKDGIVVDSSLLSSLLIEGLLKEHRIFIEENKLKYPQFFETIGEDNVPKYLPKRATVAIPNNFTASKIQQLKECIKRIPANSFQEIRFIYEAEAILVNYINQIDANSNAQESVDGENVFIYDMGGATINVTLANVKKLKDKNGNIGYSINVVSKLGYAIGGDTIDYAFLKWIFSKKDYYQKLVESDPFDEANRMDMEMRRQLKKSVLKLKIKAIENFEGKKGTLVDRMDIRNFNGLNLDPVKNTEDNGIDTSKDPFYKESLNNANSFLYSETFQKYVWSNVTSIVQDIMQICKNESFCKLDTVIMSGRSSHFPRVKSLVEDTIKRSSGFTPDVRLLPLEESKSAVARGACYFGTQKKSIHLENISTNGVFGIVQKLSPLATPDFYTLIEEGTEFLSGAVFGEYAISTQKSFGWDGNKVRFCQVMGIDPVGIIAKDEKHKYSEVAVLPALPYPIHKVTIEITDKDKIYCTTINSNDDRNTRVSKVCDMDIAACNDDHYTFFIK